jgi:predicted nucleotidyltransferase
VESEKRDRRKISLTLSSTNPIRIEFLKNDSYLEEDIMHLLKISWYTKFRKMGVVYCVNKMKQVHSSSEELT